VGERKVQALGLASSNSEIVVMPRPASPFNWTVSVFDGERYHVAHVNTRRSEPLNVGPDGNFIQRFSAPYQPERLLAWRVVPQFGDAATPAWVRQAWAAPGFDFFRWFAQTPALLSTTESEAVVNGQLSVERCAWFRDLRFEFPGREEGPFRYGVCRSEPAPAKPLGSSGASAQAVPGAIDRIFKLEGDQRIQVR
jgi:inner membrane protein